MMMLLSRITAHTILRVALVCAAYFLTARIGYLLTIPHGIVTLWPPSGVMLALLVLSPRREWASIILGGLIGSMISDWVAGQSLWFCLAAAFANVLESAVAATFLKWRLHGPLYFARLRDVGEFAIGAVVVSTAVTALVGATVLHYGVGMPFLTAWLVWWVGDGLGMLVVAPAIITTFYAFERGARPTLRKFFEGVLIFGVFVIVAQFSLGSFQLGSIHFRPFVAFPLLVWAALRFGPAGGAAGALVIASFAVWFAAAGVGPFSDVSSGVDATLQLYAFVVVASLCALVPSVILEERQAAARREAASENRYRSVVEAATDAIVTIDEDSLIEFANPAVEQIFGYTAAELIGKPLTMLMPARFAAPHMAGIARYVATGKRRMEWRAAPLTGLHRDGHEIPLEISFGDQIASGRHIFTGIIRDLSDKVAVEHALNAAEDRLRFATEAARVGVWAVDMTTGEAIWSEILEQLHGLDPGTFGGTSKAFIDLVHMDDRPAVKHEIERAIRLHADARFVYRTVWPDGSVHWLSSVGRITYDADEKPVRATGVSLDVTEQRELEQQYLQSQKMEAVGQLAGGVAHDFNNLLTVILSYGSMLAESIEKDNPLQDDIAEIVRAGNRASGLTRQLLAFSRQQVVAPQPMNLAASLQSLEPMLRRLLGEDIEIVVRADGDVGQILADPGQIEQVIVNLAVNARDAMPEGGLLVLEATNVELDEGYERNHFSAVAGRFVMLAANDNGSGMDSATVARVFEPFFSTKPAGKGTGLGLSTVYGIVEQSGGTIRIYSEPGLGTSIKIYFPRIDADVPGNAPELTDDPGGTETVIVVEDDEALRTMTVRVLTEAGYRVLSADSAQSALEVLNHQEHVHLLLTDVVLPGMHGRALAEQVQTRFPGMKVLYMSGYTDDAVVRRGVLVGETKFIQKPFTHQGIRRAVRRAIDSDT